MYAANPGYLICSYYMLPLLDVQFEWCFADAKLSLLKYGSFVSAAVQIFVRHNLFV